MKFNLNTILLSIIAGTLIASTYFLYDNYKDKQAIKNAINRSKEVELNITKDIDRDRELQFKAESDKGILLIKKGVIKTGTFKPVIYDWVFNEIINKPLMAVSDKEYLLTQNWFATIDAIRENKNIYKRYATEEEVKKVKIRLNINPNENITNKNNDIDNVISEANKVIEKAEKTLNK